MPGADRIRSPHEPVSTPVPRVRVDGVDVGDDACVGGDENLTAVKRKNLRVCAGGFGDADKRVP